MQKTNAALLAGLILLLVACVTINVYFPAAEAEKAAEKFVGDVLGEEATDTNTGQEGTTDSSGKPDTDQDQSRRVRQPRPLQNLLLWAAAGTLNVLVPDARAQDPQINIDTPQINAIKARMEQRQRSQLNGWFDAGAIGFSANGFVEIRDRAAVPLNERRALESAVAEENRDRAAVYREIAIANGNPDWEDEIQQTFAREWVQKARSGWYYQDSSGAWQKK